jgi:VWFA-related protein
MAEHHRHERAAEGPIVLVALVLALAMAAVVQSAQNPPAPSARPPVSQPPSEPQQRPPTIRSGADLVRVDVTVIDQKGSPVPSLTADDFEVREDDVPQVIQSFKFVSVNGEPEDGDEVSLPIRSREHAAAEASRDDVRVFLIFWDEYHISRMNGALPAREYLTRFVRQAFGTKDLVAFMDPLTTIDSVRFTRDRLELAEKVRTLQGRSGVYTPVRSLIEEAHMYSREGVERLRSQVTMSALKSAAVHLGTLRQGRKAIVLITEGMRDLGRDEPAMISDLTQAANDSNTAIYTLNPLGLTMRRWQRFDMMQALAASTGAESFMTNDFERALRRVVVQSSAYYLLGYAPGQRALDGKFHRIRVRVKRPGVDIRARAGYWAPTVRDMQRASREAADSLPPAIAGALAELSPATARRSVDVWIGTGVGSEGRPEVRFVWAPRDAEGTADGPDVSGASLVATSESGRAFAGDVQRGGVAFEAPPGPLQIALTVRDAAGETVDRHSRTITVPDPAASGIWISSPAVIRTSSARELRNAQTDPASTPAAAREFARSDRLLIRFAINGAHAGQATVTARLLNQRAAALTPLTVVPHGAGYEIDLPLVSIARGDFLVAIQAAHGDERSDVYVPIRITR